MRHPCTTAAVLLGVFLAGAFTAQAQTPKAEDRPRLRIGGFTDVNFSDVDLAGGGKESGFRQGQFVLHFSAELTDRLSVFAETTLTATSGKFEADVERAIIRLDHNDYFKVSFGKYHTAVNWWNTAFHHGLWLQTTISRPEMTQFGGKFIPVHFEGIQFDGAIPSGPAGLAYTAAVGNGRASNVSGAGEAGDANNNRAALVQLYARPDRLFKLRVGGAVYRDRITLASGEEFRERLHAVHVVWEGETPELIAEFARTEHTSVVTGIEHRSDAWYVQAAYRLPVAGEALKPYVRVEEMDIAAADPVFAGVPRLERALVGLRWDAAAYLAFKLEFRRDDVGAFQDLDGVFAQASVAF